MSLRKHTASFKVTTEELKQIQKYAAALGLSFSAYLRRIALLPTDRNDAEYLKEVTGKLKEVHSQWGTIVKDYDKTMREKLKST